MRYITLIFSLIVSTNADLETVRRVGDEKPTNELQFYLNQASKSQENKTEEATMISSTENGVKPFSGNETVNVGKAISNGSVTEFSTGSLTTRNNLVNSTEKIELSAEPFSGTTIISGQVQLTAFLTNGIIVSNKLNETTESIRIQESQTSTIDETDIFERPTQGTLKYEEATHGLDQQNSTFSLEKQSEHNVEEINNRSMTVSTDIKIKTSKHPDNQKKEKDTIAVQEGIIHLNHLEEQANLTSSGNKSMNPFVDSEINKSTQRRTDESDIYEDSSHATWVYEDQATLTVHDNFQIDKTTSKIFDKGQISTVTTIGNEAGADPTSTSGVFEKKYDDRALDTETSSNKSDYVLKKSTLAVGNRASLELTNTTIRSTSAATLDKPTNEVNSEKSTNKTYDILKLLKESLNAHSSLTSTDKEGLTEAIPNLQLLNQSMSYFKSTTGTTNGIVSNKITIPFSTKTGENLGTTEFTTTGIFDTITSQNANSSVLENVYALVKNTSLGNKTKIPFLEELNSSVAVQDQSI